MAVGIAAGLLGFIVGFCCGAKGMVSNYRNAIKRGVIEDRGKIFRLVPVDKEIPNV